MSSAAKSTTKGATGTAPKATGSAPGTTKSKIIAVTVGSPTVNKSLVFVPADVKANPGDILQFQFSQINHTVTQSTFVEPCQPIQASDPAAAGIHSGFVPVTAGASTVTTFDVPVNDTKPIFIYCAQGPHCQLGMVMAVNANGNETLAAYKSAAAKAEKNVPAANFKGGVMGSIPAADAVPPPV
ncbi:extracellular serine-rich protein [Hyaloscypha sp. PMI_1271]|nr:extracellular serine-rich protein [Hyaloscypha sp. PMI_1271]